MLKKRGQLTLFVIAGVLIAVAIIGYFFIWESNENELDFDSKGEVIKEEVLGCMEGIYWDSLDLVGFQGGYYDEPVGDYVVQETGDFLSYYIDEDGIFLPPIEFIESELGVAVDNSLDYCFRTISLNYPELEIFFLKGNTSVSVRDDGVGFVSPVNVAIVGENKSLLFEFDEEKVVMSNLKGMHDLADYYLYMNMLYGDSIPADGLVDSAEENRVTVDVTDYGKEVLMVSVFPLNDLSYPRIFNFLHKFEGEEKGEFLTDVVFSGESEDELNDVDFGEEV